MALITRYGRPEAFRFTGIAALLGVGAWFVHPILAIAPLLLLAFVLRFFRDPERPLPPDERAVVSPADGKITDVTVVREEAFLGEEALRVGIFLSVFDVHVNRVPLSGKVAFIEYRPGKFRNALHTEACSRENEANLVGLIAAGGLRVMVKQISGAIARRIVCPIQIGDSLRRGDRFGMIKFGSRTELFVPTRVEFVVRVKVGDHVKGGETILGVLRA
ncbi:MAG: phosphatidylserine decarboxylase family protein [Planctomycetes bacterium]|nr:phosphatidylserine decarboxylase family protein [Planctomycetota bacterium]MBI3844115.1 phosphatidylserine decarboxylase family protein [Planctomycetota bacterium]